MQAPTLFYNSFHGATVNVSAEPYLPFWGEGELRVSDGSREITYFGSDFELLNAVALALNFTFRVLPTSSWEEVTQVIICLCTRLP